MLLTLRSNSTLRNPRLSNKLFHLRLLKLWQTPMEASRQPSKPHQPSNRSSSRINSTMPTWSAPQAASQIATIRVATLALLSKHLSKLLVGAMDSQALPMALEPSKRTMRILIRTTMQPTLHLDQMQGPRLAANALLRQTRSQIGTSESS